MKGHTGAFLFGLLILWLLVIFVVWRLVCSVRKSSDPGRLISKWILTLVLMGIEASVAVGARLDDMASAFIIPISAAVCGVILGIIWGSSIGEILASPLMNLYAGGEPDG